MNFLNQLYPGGPWVLTSIIPDGNTRTQTFFDDEKARKWIVRENDKGRNVHYTLNRTREPLRSKPSKTDIELSKPCMLTLTPKRMRAPRSSKNASYQSWRRSNRYRVLSSTAATGCRPFGS